MRLENVLAALCVSAVSIGGVGCSSPAGPSTPLTGAGGARQSGSGGTGGSGVDNIGGKTGGLAPTDGGPASASGGRDGGGQTGSATGSGGSGGSNDAGGATGGATGLTMLPPWPNGAILTGVRDVTAPPVTQIVQLRNDATTTATLTALAISGANQAAFRIDGATLPISFAPGVSMPFTVEVLTTGAALPAAPPQNSGGTLLTATLTATDGAGNTTANLFGLLLTTATHEVTLGQILVTLGFKLNVGLAQNNANPNTGTVEQLPKIEAGTDEIDAPLFRKIGTGTASLRAVARFSPKGPMPFGWYPMGSPATHNLVATMESIPDAQTSDKARMVLPPLTGSTDFDPGAGTFGIWVYTDQLSQKFDTGGTATNGDYAYSEDGPNSPANVHRTKVYPLKDATGQVVAGSFLLAVEEAGNGDYQDYVFVLSNVMPAN